MNIDLNLLPKDQLMTDSLWKLVIDFNRDEKWGDPLKMQLHLIYWLDALRKYVGSPLIIHCGYEKEGHVSKSQHRWGNAVDLHSDTIHYKTLLCAALLFPFAGIGIYPYWNNPGLHLDMRKLVDGEPKKIWYRDKDNLYHNIRYDKMLVNYD